jgi:hypothetical protein
MLFERTDGTLAYYFTIEYFKQLVEESGVFSVVELEYATVQTVNRKTSSVIHRVFVHAVIEKL